MENICVIFIGYLGSSRQIIWYSPGSEHICIAARLITGNFDYINCRGIDLVKSLNLYNIRDRIDYFLTKLMFKAIHGIVPTYLSDRIVVNFDVNSYDTKGSDMDSYLPTLRKEAYRSSFMCMGGKLWNGLPEFVQNSKNIESFKHNYRMYKRITSSWQNRHFSFWHAISQFLYEVMIISLLPENSTLYMDMDFCILLGMGWISILCYICVTTLHDSYLYIESHPYVLLSSIT